MHHRASPKTASITKGSSFFSFANFAINDIDNPLLNNKPIKPANPLEAYCLDPAIATRTPEFHPAFPSKPATKES
jgi:hypothetical protein